MTEIASLGLSVDSDGVVTADKRLDELAKGAKKAETATQKLVRQTEKMSKAADKMGRNLTKFVTLPLLGIGIAAVKFASDFESSFANVRKTVNATEEQFAQMADEIRELAQAVPTTVDELNRLAGVAGQLGVQRENIVEFTKVIALLGDTTDISGEQAALSLSRFMNVMGTAQENIDRVGSTIVGLGNNFAAMESEIVTTATSLAAFGSQMGLTEAQVLAFATAIAASGGQTEAASTAFQKTASTMQRAVIEINKDLQVFADVAGVSAEKFSQVFREDAAGAIQLFLQGLKNVSDQGLSTAAVLEAVGLADQRLQREFGKLLGNLDDLDSALVQADDEWEKNTALTDEAEKRYKTFASQLGIFKNQLKDVAIELGTALIPHIKDLRDEGDGLIAMLRRWVTAFSELDAGTQKTVLKLFAFTAAIGPLLIVFASLTRAVSTLLPILLAIGGPLSLVLATVGFLIIKTFEWQRELNELNGVLDLASDSADRFALAIANATQAKDLADEINEIKGAVTTLDAELMKINEELSVFAGTDASSNPIFQGLLEEKERVEAALNDLGDVFHNLRQRQRELAEGTVETNAALEEAVVIAQRVGDTLKLTADELEALTDFWVQLRADIDPVAEATRNYEASVVLLDLAIANVDPTIDRAAAIAQLKKEMDDASGATDALAAAGEAWVKVLEDSEGAREALKSFEDLEKALKDEIKALKGGEAAWREYSKAQFISNKLAELGEDATNDQIIAVQKLAAELFEVGNAVEDAATQVQRIGEGMMAFGAIAGGVLSDIQSAVGRGTDEYRALEVAIASANLVAAIGAVLNQSTGDPYTAFARMAAMASVVSALLGVAISISNLSGGFTDTAAQRQANQGAGGVLGDAQAKTESILNATEITADAASELVGINKGMLRALERLNTGLSGASGALARNPQGGEFSGLPSLPDSGKIFAVVGAAIGTFFGPLGTLVGGILGGALGKLLGGKTKVTDEGIAILAGSLNDAIDGTLFAAFQEIQSKKFFFSSKKTREELIALGDEASAQISLIFQAIGDTVREGAIALGLDAIEVQAALDAFQVAEQRISLKDLSAEEQQAELEAVFGQIFDDLAGAVVPFIGQFQQVGEGLGETLIRVATSVQVMQEAIKQLGLAVDTTDPEQFAQISVSLIEMVGGIDQFISKFKNFTSKFATDEHKFEVAQDELIRAFEQVGLTVPTTTEGMFDLLQSLDATTEQGRRQIATLLELADVADEFFSLLEDVEKKRADALNAEVDALIHIQNIAEGVVDMLTSLRDLILDDISTPKQQFERASVEAERLAEALATMTDPDQIDATVRRIEQLTRTAFGLLDEDQKQAMGQGFLTFIDEVQALALERLSLSADEVLANTAFTPEEVLARFNSEVTDPLILVASLQESAALKLLQAAEFLMGQTPADFSIQPGVVPIIDPIDPVGPFEPTQGISDAVQAGMQAGAKAMAEAAAAIVTSGASSDATSAATAQQIAQAITSIPTRIIVERPESEFA